LLSKGKITFQSFFMLMTVQAFFFASAISASLNVPIFDFSAWNVGAALKLGWRF